MPNLQYSSALYRANGLAAIRPGPLVLNQNHWAAAFFVGAIIPRENELTLISNLSYFPQTWSIRGTVSPRLTAEGPAQYFNFTTSQVYKSPSQSIFGGIKAMSFIGKWRSGSSSHQPYGNIVRKDLEYTSLQYDNLNHMVSVWWGTVNGFTVLTSTLVIGAGDIVDAAVITDYPNGILSNNLRPNYGAVSTVSTSVTAGQSVVVNAANGLLIGGDEGFGQLINDDYLYYGYFFNRAFSESEYRSIWDDPMALWTTPEGEISALMGPTDTLVVRKRYFLR